MTARASWKPGDVLGEKYRIVGLLGEGGMGTVYSAHHELLDQAVAVKVLRAGSGSEKKVARERFLREGTGHVAASIPARRARQRCRRPPERRAVPRHGATRR